MDDDHTRELLKMRRELTGITYNDDTVTAWQAALGSYEYNDVVSSLLDAAKVGRVMVADIVAHMPHDAAVYQPPEPPDAELTSLDEYLRRLRRRAASGSFDAQRELLSWAKQADRTRDLKSWTRHPANPNNEPDVPA